MRKWIIGSVSALLFAAWGIRFYALNGTFKVHSPNEIKYYSINEEVDTVNCSSYNVIEQGNLTLSVKNVRIIEADDYLQELDKTAEDFLDVSERYLEVTINVKNNDNDTEAFLDPYGFPVFGTNWYIFYDPDATKFANKMETESRFIAIELDTGSTCDIKIVYPIRWADFNSSQWENLEKEKMWLYVTMSPIEKRIEL